MTQPTASSKAWIRERDARLSELARFIRENGGTVRRKLHSEAFERGTIAPLGHDALRQEITAVHVMPFIAEAIGL